MGTISEFDALSEPVDDTEDTEIEMDMNDDELLFDDYELDEELEVEDSKAGEGAIPGWRRIEMFRESRMLRSELADFEDYDSLDSGYGYEPTVYAP